MSKGGITRQELGGSLNQELDFITGSKKVEKSFSGTSTVKTLIKSPVNVLRINGKTIINLAPLFDSGAWSSPLKSASYVVNSPTKITHTNTTGTFESVNGLIPVKPNATYRIKANTSGNGKVKIYVFDGGSGYNLVTDTANPQDVTITTLASTRFLHVELSNEGVNGTVATFENLSITEGSQIYPFVANVKGLTNPTIVNEMNNTSLVVPTTLYDGEYVEQNEKGELVKHKRFEEIILNGSQNWMLDGTLGTGHKGVYFAIPKAFKSAIVVKHDGTVLRNYDGLWTGDTFHSGTNTFDFFEISIPNKDSGWGENYMPTSDEIKAYFLGWIMYQVEEATQGRIVPYNGVGEKIWAVRNTPNSGYVSSESADRPLVKGTGTKVLPTVSASDFGFPNTAWQPYRLVYELTTPIKEVVRPYSDLTLEKGDNSVKVYAGRIVNEYTKLSFDGGSWNINNPASSAGAPILKYKALDITSLYENNKETIEQWDKIPRTDMNGMFLQGILYNPTASYKVDYDPFYTWKVTAPIDSVQLQYFETMQAVVDELTLENAKQQETINHILDNVVNKSEGIIWTKPTCVNGVTRASTCRFGKDSNGTAYVYVYITIPRVMSSTDVLFHLPKGYRPNETFYVPSIEYSDTSNRQSGLICVSQDGTISTGMPTAFSSGTIIASAVYKAEK